MLSRLRAAPAVLAVTAVLAVATLLAGCGQGTGSSTASAQRNVLTGLDAPGIARLAAATTAATSMRFDLTATLTADLGGVHGLPLGALLGSSPRISLTGSGVQESARRLQLTISLPPLITQPMTVVDYDGQAFVSVDGTRYASLPSLGQGTGGLGINPTDVRSLLGPLADRMHDLGPATEDGVAVHHLQLSIDRAALTTLYGDRGSSTANPLGIHAFDFVKTLSGTLDAYVRVSDGRLDRVTYAADVVIDFSGIASALEGGLGGIARPGSSPTATPGTGAGAAGGTGELKLTVGGYFHDYGAAIHITKPTVTPGAPTVPAGLGSLGALLG